MIVTITPNPTMDKIYITNEFRPNRRFIASGSRKHPGGKGVNASVILKQLGFESIAMGFLAGHTGAYIREALLALGVSTNFVNIKGENRTATFIRDDEGGTETAVCDEGPEVFEDAQKRFFWKLDRLLHRVSAVHMGGPLPPGVPDSFYFDIVDRARAQNIPVFIDAGGPELDRALGALPTVVRLDYHHLSAIGGGASRSALDHIIAKSKHIFDEGVDWVVASYFYRSNIFCTTKGFYLAETPSAELAQSYRSADDALIAGMIAAREERMGIEDTIRFSMGCAHAVGTWPGVGLESRAAAEQAAGDVTVQKL